MVTERLPPVEITELTNLAPNDVTLIDEEVPAPPDVTLSPTGLVAVYPFDEGAGATLADASGNGWDLSITGASWNSSPPRLTGDGIDDRAVNTSVPAIGTGTLTILVSPHVAIAQASSHWMASLGGGQITIIHDHGSNPNSVVVRRASDAFWYYASFGEAPTVNGWTVLTGVYDGTNVSSYRNGAHANTTVVGGSLWSSHQRINLFSGLDTSAGSAPFVYANCSIAFAIVRNVGLDAAGVAEDYAYIKAQADAKGITLP